MRRFSAFMFGTLASKLHGLGIDKNTQASGEIPRLYVRPIVPQEFVILHGVCPSSGYRWMNVSRQMLGYLCDKRETSGSHHPRPAIPVQLVPLVLPSSPLPRPACCTQFAFNPLINSLRYRVLYDQLALYCHFLSCTYELELMRSASLLGARASALFLI